MFEIFSWSEYLFGLLIAAVVYYIFVTLTFYRKEFLNPTLFVRQDNKVERSTKPTNNQPDLMGKAQPDFFPILNHVSLENQDQLVIAEEKNRSTDTDKEANDALLTVSIADLLQDAKTLVQVIAENKPEKEQTIGMIQALLSRYSHLSNTKFRSAINLYILDLIKDDLSIHMNPVDIDQLWNEHKKS